MADYKVELLDKQEVAEDTMSFWLEKPEGYNFEPGQHIDVTLLDPPETDDKGDIRTFSLSNTPGEGALMFTTRMRDSAFKRVLRSMEPGEEVQIGDPYGDLVLPNATGKRVVLLAGGIGITPFRSMVFHAYAMDKPYFITLFYSNKTHERAAFIDEFEELDEKYPKFNLVATMTEADSWDGRVGRIDPEMIEDELGNLDDKLYYLAGPPGLVQGIKSKLVESGIERTDIRTEEFPGY